MSLRSFYVADESLPVLNFWRDKELLEVRIATSSRLSWKESNVETFVMLATDFWSGSFHLFSLLFHVCGVLAISPSTHLHRCFPSSSIPSIKFFIFTFFLALSFPFRSPNLYALFVLCQRGRVDWLRTSGFSTLPSFKRFSHSRLTPWRYEEHEKALRKKSTR